MEQASFALTDPPALVHASLSCPMCLHAVQWRASGSGTQPAVECECRNCGHTRTVELTATQMLRLNLVVDGDEDGPVLDPGRGATWRGLFMLL
jgi:hypothetical protein